MCEVLTSASEKSKNYNSVVFYIHGLIFLFFYFFVKQKIFQSLLLERDRSQVVPENQHLSCSVSLKRNQTSQYCSFCKYLFDWQVIVAECREK